MRETHVGVSVHLSMPPFSVTKVTLEMQMSVCQPVTKTPQHYAYQQKKFFEYLDKFGVITCPFTYLGFTILHLFFESLPNQEV